MNVVKVGQEFIESGHLQSEALIEDLLKRWQELRDAVEARNQILKSSEIAQQAVVFTQGLHKNLKTSSGVVSTLADYDEIEMNTKSLAVSTKILKH